MRGRHRVQSSTDDFFRGNRMTAISADVCNCNFHSGRSTTEITAAEFARAKSASQNLLRVLFIENKFDPVLANYVEFEHEILDRSLRRMIYGSLTWSVGHKIFRT
jgi:hypothetical protein